MIQEQSTKEEGSSILHSLPTTSPSPNCDTPEGICSNCCPFANLGDADYPQTSTSSFTSSSTMPYSFQQSSQSNNENNVLSLSVRSLCHNANDNLDYQQSYCSSEENSTSNQTNRRTFPPVRLDLGLGMSSLPKPSHLGLLLLVIISLLPCSLGQPRGGGALNIAARPVS